MTVEKIFIAGPCFTGSRFEEDIAICTGNGVIEKIAPLKAINLSEADTVDMSQYILIPPFRDAHMHFMVDGRPAEEDEAQKILNIYLNNGIFSITDAGLKDAPGLAYKKEHNCYPEITTSGYAIYRHGCYGSFLGRGVCGIEDIKKAVKALCDSGADFIKVINSGIVSTHKPYHITEGGFTHEELAVIIGEVSQRGKKVVCHANSDMAVRGAVEAGAASIAHGYFVREETLCMMAEKRVSLVPTLYALKSLVPYLGAEDAGFISEIVAGHAKTIKLASDLGVELNVGSDSAAKGLAHGAGFFKEMEEFSAAGLSTEEVLRAACVDGIKVGNKANFLAATKEQTGKEGLRFRVIEGKVSAINGL